MLLWIKSKNCRNLSCFLGLARGEHRFLYREAFLGLAGMRHDLRARHACFSFCHMIKYTRNKENNPIPRSDMKVNIEFIYIYANVLTIVF